MGRSGPPWDRGEAGQPQSRAQQWSVMPQAEFELSAENETGELMSSGGAKDASVLIPAPGEQPGKGERAPALAGQLGPHSGARPAGQPPAGASRQARGCSGWPAPAPTSPCCLWLRAEQDGVLLWVGPWGKSCDRRVSTRTPDRPQWLL